MCGKLSLNCNELLNERLVLFKHLYVALWNRTRDDEWGTGIVNKYRVHLIHDGEVVTTLHEILRLHCHVVAEVVETELVVCTECDICLIGSATSL